MALTLPFHQDCLLVFSFVVHFSIWLAFVNASQLPSLSICGILCSIRTELATYWLCEQRHICLRLATFSLFPWPVYNFLLYVSCKKKLQNSVLQVSCFICSLQKPVKSSINCFFYLLVVRLAHVWTQITLRMFQLRSACFNYGMLVWNVHSLPGCFFAHSFRISNIHIVGSVGCVIYFSLYVPYSFTYPPDVRFCVPSLRLKRMERLLRTFANICAPAVYLSKIWGKLWT